MLVLIVDGVIVTPPALKTTRRPAPSVAVSVIVVPCGAVVTLETTFSEPVAPLGVIVIG